MNSPYLKSFDTLAYLAADQVEDDRIVAALDVADTMEKFLGIDDDTLDVKIFPIPTDANAHSQSLAVVHTGQSLYFGSWNNLQSEDTKFDVSIPLHGGDITRDTRGAMTEELFRIMLGVIRVQQRIRGKNYSPDNFPPLMGEAIPLYVDDVTYPDELKTEVVLESQRRSTWLTGSDVNSSSQSAPYMSFNELGELSYQLGDVRDPDAAGFRPAVIVDDAFMEEYRSPTVTIPTLAEVLEISNPPSK